MVLQWEFHGQSLETGMGKHLSISGGALRREREREREKKNGSNNQENEGSEQQLIEGSYQ